MASPQFMLSKWYLDCVAADGETFIGYAARIRWKRLVLNYSSSLIVDISGRPRSGTSLRSGPLPALHDDTLTWSSRELDVEGTWRATAAPIERCLLETPTGSLLWSCLMPGAAVEVAIGDLRLTGAGYAEHLTMTLPPWELPIDELRWGRFVSGMESLVWIDWRGPRPMTLVVHNGRDSDAGMVTDTLVAMDGGSTSLRLDGGTVLRSGALLTTALANIPGIERFAPARILGAEECKWRSRGLLERKGRDTKQGWAIHEVVRFA